MKQYLIDEDAIGGYADEGEFWVKVFESSIEELPPGAKLLTREDVERVLERVTMDRDIEDVLNHIFGKEDSDDK